jgi:hypothetical protein
MVWFFGSLSGYYGLYAAKAMVATFANVFLTIGNAAIFAVNGVYTIISLGIVTIINQLFYYFIGGILEVINIILTYIPIVGQQSLDFVPIGNQTISFEPPVALAYLVPEPINATDIVTGIMSTLFGYSFIKPGAQFYEYNMATDSYVVEVAFVGENFERLYLPKINRAAKVDGLLTNMSGGDRPPPIQYNFTTNVAGYVQRYNQETKKMEWVLVNQKSISKTIFEDVFNLLFGGKSDSQDIYYWLEKGYSYFEKVKNTKGEIYNEQKIIYQSANSRHYYFFIASLKEWKPSLIDGVPLLHQNTPESWFRSGSITGSDGKTYNFRECANKATAYVADKLSDKSYPVSSLKELEDKERKESYETLCMDLIYPLYVEWIKENVASWYPLS